MKVSWDVKGLKMEDGRLRIDGREIALHGTGSAEIVSSESRVSLVLAGSPSMPTRFSLEQNYPNPFNPTTVFSFSLPVSSYVTLKVFDVLGEEVATLVHEIHEAGHKRIEWDASSVASGIYFYRFEAISVSNPASTFTQVRKMVVIK